ncbi:MAG TPA: Stp1/IreP family PP2C-type Ser/Thr phosphatase [Bacteroidales bacterium]|nr:Stp1/IreP family PP2C-type Ser/Thr phosphatase [Bacteroidales bacterium]
MSKANEPKVYDLGVATHSGQVMLENQDCYTDFECINGHVFIVCDGMGVHEAGAVASGLAVESIRAYLENHYFDLPEDALKAAIEFSNSVVYKRSKLKPEYQGMGTTIVMAMLRNNKFHYAHVGDSRVYIFSDGKLHRLTRDHSQVQDMVDRGLLSDDEARTHPKRKEITRALGTCLNIEIEFCTAPALPAMNDFILMCTDGLFFMLDDYELSQVLNVPGSAQEKAEKLISLTNDKGAPDNITAMLIHFIGITNKRAVFSPVFYVPKEMKPLIKKEVSKESLSATESNIIPEETPAPEEIIAREPVKSEPIEGNITGEQPVDEQPGEEEQVEEDFFNEEPIDEDFLKETAPIEETHAWQNTEDDFIEKTIPVEEEPAPAARKIVHEMVSETPDTEEVSPERNKTSDNTNIDSFLDRFGFYRKLKKKPDLMRKIRLGAIILGVLFVAYVFWDIFIKQSAPTQVTEDKKSRSIVTEEEPKDTLPAKDQVAAQPDTIWINYSVKKGEFLGTIASKFGVTVDFIKAKNKLSNDNIREKQKLDIPTKANHTVKAGESFATIAQKYNIPAKSLMKANDIKDEKNIKTDKSLIIPFK